LTDERRLERQINGYRESEARWLQKVLFATAKASEARMKLSEATNENLNPLITLDDGTSLPIDKLESVIQKRVDDLMDALGQGQYNRKR
jgi:hypothetical protein